MATKSEEELTKLVTRAVAQVAKEIEAYERAFGVEDLQKHVAKLREVGGDIAWKITYDTAGSSIERLRDVAQVGGEVAWKITYDTAGSPIEQVKM